MSRLSEDGGNGNYSFPHGGRQDREHADLRPLNPQLGWHYDHDLQRRLGLPFSDPIVTFLFHELFFRPHPMLLLHCHFISKQNFKNIPPQSTSEETKCPPGSARHGFPAPLCLGSMLSVTRTRPERCPFSGPHPTLTSLPLCSHHSWLLQNPHPVDAAQMPFLREALLMYLNNPTNGHLTFLKHQGTTFVPACQV